MQDNNFIKVEGKRFHYIWLRDNCLCPECRHPTSFQKIYDISEAQSFPKPLSVLEENEKLTIMCMNNLFIKVYFLFLGY